MPNIPQHPPFHSLSKLPTQSNGNSLVPFSMRYDDAENVTILGNDAYGRKTTTATMSATAAAAAAVYWEKGKEREGPP